MNVNAATLMIGLGEPAEDLIRKTVEELWQKGYELRKAGSGWLVQEPLGAKKIELGSDVELIRFANTGGRRWEDAAIFEANPSQDTVLENQETVPSVATTDPASIAEQLGSERHLSPKKNLDELWCREKKRWLAWFVFLRRYSHEPAAHAWLAMVLFLVMVSLWWSFREVSVEQIQEDGLPTAKIIQEEKLPEISSMQNELTQSSTQLASKSPAVKSNLPVPRGEPLHLLPEIPQEQAGATDLSIYSDRCSDGIKQRYSTNALSLLINAEGRHAGECFKVGDLEHCPYVSKDKATLSYLDTGASVPTIYACDINLEKGAYGNLRKVRANPDIVRFIAGEIGTR